MKNDWWNYLQHASVAGSDGVSTTKSRSKYKGGFVNGKNTSEYNHDYYIHNKDKWGVSGQDDIDLKGIKPDELSDEDYYKLIEQAIKNKKERTGHDWTPEDANDFWVSMAEEFGLDDYGDDAKNRERYERVMQGYRAKSAAMSANAEAPKEGSIKADAKTELKNNKVTGKSSSSGSGASKKVSDLLSKGSSGKSSGSSGSSGKSSGGSGSSSKGSSKDDGDDEKSGSTAKSASKAKTGTSKKSKKDRIKESTKNDESIESVYKNELERFRRIDANYERAKAAWTKEQRLYGIGTNSNGQSHQYRVLMNKSYIEYQNALKERQEAETKLKQLAEELEKKQAEASKTKK